MWENQYGRQRTSESGPLIRRRDRVVLLIGFVAGLSCGDSSTAPNRPPTPAPPPAPRPTSVTVSPPTAELTAVGDTVRLSAEVRDQEGRVIPVVAVSWSTGDTSVVTVDSAGLVTAASPGQSVVTARAASVSGEARVSVRPVAASVVLSPAAPQLPIGDTVRLFAEVQDANGHSVGHSMFSWSSENEYVATVDSTGLVRARVRGKATITARSGTIAGSADVTVSIPPVPPNFSVDEKASHSLQHAGLYVSHASITDRHQYWNPARAYVDFNADGLVDIFYSPHDGSTAALPAELYINNGGGGFHGIGGFDLHPSFYGPNTSGGVHPRKALSGDFNGDGKGDVFVLDHGL